MSTLKLSHKPKKLARFHSWKWNHISRHSGTSAKNKKSAGTPEYPSTFEVAACPFALEQFPARVCSKDNDTPDSTAFLSLPASLSQTCCSTCNTQTSLQLFHDGIPSASDVSREKNRLAPGDCSTVLVRNLSDDDVFLKEGDGGEMENGVVNMFTLNCSGSCSGDLDLKNLGTERVVFAGSTDDEIHSQTTPPTFTLLPVDAEDRKGSNVKEMDKGGSAKQALPCRSGNSPRLTPFPSMRALSPPVLKLKSKLTDLQDVCLQNSRAQTLCHSPRLSGYIKDPQLWRMVDKKRSRSFSATDIRNKGIPEGVCVCSCESVCESDVLVKHVEILTPTLDAPLPNSPVTTRVLATYSLKVSEECSVAHLFSKHIMWPEFHSFVFFLLNLFFEKKGCLLAPQKKVQLLFTKSPLSSP